MKRMEQRCLEVTENAMETIQSLQGEKGKLWGPAAAVLPVQAVGLPGSYWGEDQRSLFGWSGKLTCRPLGDTGWMMLVSHRIKINKPCYSFLGLLYQLVVWPRTSDTEGSFSITRFHLMCIFRWKCSGVHGVSYISEDSRHFMMLQFCRACIMHGDNNKLWAIKQHFPF